MSRKRELRAFVIAVAAAAALAPASAAAKKSATKIEASVMDRANTAHRRSLAIDSVPLVRMAGYAPFRCNYDLTVQALEGEPSTTRLDVVMKQVRDRLLATWTGPGQQPSTVLIAVDGQLIDFNFADFLGGKRSTSENYRANAHAYVANLRSTHRTVQVLNEVTLIFPHYINRTPRPGEVSAVVTAEDGSIWGRYVYRGLTQYAGQRVALFDLTHVSQAMGGRNTTVGYDLVDPATMAPVLTIVDAGSKLRFARSGCS